MGYKEGEPGTGGEEGVVAGERERKEERYSQREEERERGEQGKKKEKPQKEISQW